MRNLTPYEQTHILRYKPQLLSAVVAGEFGETPVEYITSVVEFCGLNLHVDARVLIPRIETEDLVARVNYSIDRLYNNSRRMQVVEVGTGSGAIGLALWKNSIQHKYSNIEFHLLDISPDALTVAKQNASKIKRDIAARKPETDCDVPKIHFLVSDLLQQWPSGERIDILVANLPYIPTQRLKILASCVREFEPLLALDGGKNGLTLIHSLLKQAKSFMSKKSVCWLEIDDSHTAALLVKNDVDSPRWKCEDMVDEFGKMRFARCNLTK